MTPLNVPFLRSIRFRLSAVMAAVIFAVALAAAVLSCMQTLERSAAARATLLETAASGFSAAISEPLAVGDRQGVMSALRGVRDLEAVVNVRLTDAQGKTVAQLGTGAALVDGMRDLKTLRGIELFSAQTAEVRKTVLKSGAVIGEIRIIAGIEDLKRELISDIVSTLMLAMVGIAGAVAVAQIMITRMTLPLSQLAVMMSDAGARQDFSRKMPPSAQRDETALLGDAFNTMIDSLVERDGRIARHLETLEKTVEERTQDYRLAKEEAEAANAAKSDFLATISHEIRTPMNGMMVMAEMLASAELAQKHRRYAEIIMRSGNNLLTIINDILDLSKIEAGKLDLEETPFSIDAMIEDVSALFWERARSKGLDLSFVIARDTPSLIVGDPTRVNQIINNLVNNALKFTEAGGVTISVRPCLTPSGSAVEFSVIDTGVGIDPSRLDAIFDAFSQEDKSTTRKFGGTGLGLSVCKKLVEAMKGDITVASTPGSGSTFSVRIPFPVAEEAPSIPNGDGLCVALACRSDQIAAAAEAYFRDLAIPFRRISQPSLAHKGELLIASCDMFKAETRPQAAASVALCDLGETGADALLERGVIVDTLALPIGRRGLYELVARARSGDFRRRAAANGGEGADVRPRFSGLRVLAVDDNAVNREVLREALLSLGVEPDLAENGAEAVRAASETRYDIIFMDGSMPVMDGFQATRMIRRHEVENGRLRTHICALTANLRSVDAAQWTAAGADAHMSKPFTAKRLIEALRSVRPDHDDGPDEEASPTTADELFDEGVLSDMDAAFRRSGRDVLSKVWKLFLIEAPRATARLAELVGDGGDADQIVSQAHLLKSICLSAGAAGAAAAAHQIESLAKSGMTGGQQEAVDALRTTLERTTAAMEDRLNERATRAQSVA